MKYKVGQQLIHRGSKDIYRITREVGINMYVLRNLYGDAIVKSSYYLNYWCIRNTKLHRIFYGI